MEELTGGGRAQLQLALSGDVGAADLIVIKRIAAPRTAAGLTELTEEIALARRLDHDAIVRCRAIGFEAGCYFMVSDYLDGIPLGTLLRAAALRGAQVSNAVVARVLLAILNAVDYADQVAPSPAARALVHQTVTIEDVFLTLDGDVKILGFKGGRSDAAVSSEAAAIDALLAGHLTRELALVLHHAVQPAQGAADAAAGDAGERYSQIRGALQAWQARSPRGDGRADTARAVRTALPIESVERRARIAAARAAEVSPAEVAPETALSMVSDEPPVSGMRPALRVEQPAQPPPLPSPDPLDDDEATIAEPARQALDVQFAPVAPPRRRVVPYALAAIGASTLVFAYAVRPPAGTSVAVAPDVRVASAVTASAVTTSAAAKPVASVPVASVPVASVPVASVPVASVPVASVPVASVPAASRTIPSTPTASVAPVSFRFDSEGPSSATPALAQSAAALAATQPAAAHAPATGPVAAAPVAAAAAAATPVVAPSAVPGTPPKASIAPLPLPATVAAPLAPAVAAPLAPAVAARAAASPADAPVAPSAAAVTAFSGARAPAPVPAEVNAVPGSTSTSTSTSTPTSASRPRPGMPVPEGHLTLDSTPWAAVYLGGNLLGQTPLVELPLPAGDHALDLVNPDQGISTTYVVHIEGGKTTVRRVGLEKPGAPQ